MNKKIISILALTLATSLILITLTGCFGSTAVAAGWAGINKAGNNLYTVSGQGQLVALTSADDQFAWSSPVVGTPASGGFLGCAASSSVVAVYGTPVVVGDLIYVAGYNGSVYSFSISKQSETAHVALDKDDPKPVVGGLVADKGQVFVGSADGSLYALNGATLAQAWKFSTGSKIWSTPAVDKGVVFIGSFDKKVYAVDEITGKQKWTTNVNGAMVATPVIDNGVVYVVSFGRQIYALDEATGAIKWQFPAAGQSGNTPRDWFWATPVVSNGILYAPNMDGKVYALNTQDGSLAATFDLGSSISSVPTVVDSRVIVATNNAKIYALDAGSNQKELILDLRSADSQSGLIVDSQLYSANGVVYVHALSPDRVYAVNVAAKTFKTFALSGVTSSPTATATATATVTTVIATTVTATVTTTK